MNCQINLKENNMAKKSDISLDDFKKWIEEDFNQHTKVDENNESQFDEDEVQEVVSKISLRKLHLKAEVDEGYAEEVCLDFYKNGGKVIDRVDDTFLIEVQTGQLYIKKSYVESL